MSAVMLLYRLLLPAYVLLALPAWLLKTARRGGLGARLWERAGVFQEELDFEPAGAVHVHAVSVGEALLALKLIRGWLERDPAADFVLAVGTPTGREVAMAGAPEGVRVVYQPVDFRMCVRRYLARFEPAQVVLVEGEMWPNLMRECGRREVPVRLVNARMSPRSRTRYERFASLVRPIYSLLGRVAVQESEDAGIWETLGVTSERIEVVGSLKFDPGTGERPTKREAFAEMLELCNPGKPIVLAASTHAGEEALIGRVVREAGGFFLCVPRHAERRAEVAESLREEGFEVVLRSAFAKPQDRESCCLVVDSTGELRDWTAHAGLVVIGKSFLGEGGQSPAEAVLAGVPVVFGPHMENFEPLASRMVDAGGVLRVKGETELAMVLEAFVDGELAVDPGEATKVLAKHEGAVQRTVALLS